MTPTQRGATVAAWSQDKIKQFNDLCDVSLVFIQGLPHDPDVIAQANAVNAMTATEQQEFADSVESNNSDLETRIPCPPHQEGSGNA